MSEASTPLPSQRRSQPKAMLPLCATEMWERFGFYIIQGMLIFLITNHFGLDDSQGVLITGEYGALVYLSPILGGYAADNYLGFNYSIFIGACFQCIGYILISTLILKLMYWGLAIIILGNGLLKPNIASYLGEFYEAEDERRQAGFTYYYVIMNLGIFAATLSAQFIQGAWGWRICFASAAVGMLIGVTIFLLCTKRFAHKGLPVRQDLLDNHRWRFVCLFLLSCAVIASLSYLMLIHSSVGNTILLIMGGCIFIYLVHLTLSFQSQQRRNMIALIWLIVFAIVFWAFFFEIFSVMNLFIERNVQRHIFGIQLPALTFMSLEPIFILIMGVPLAFLWRHLHQKNRNPNIALKFALALFSLALGMHLLTYAINNHNAQFLVLPSWIIGFYFLLTTGEMLLSPNILSTVTELSPSKVVAFMMGVQYMALGFGSSITGLLGQLAVIPKGMTDPQATNAIYHHAFSVYSLICLITGVLILISSPFIKRLIQPKQFKLMKRLSSQSLMT